MRNVLIAVVLAVLLSGAAPEPQQAPSTKPGKLFVVGGWKTHKDSIPLMRYFIGLTGKPNPKVCLLPTASGDSSDGIVAWYDVMNLLECRPRHLRLFQTSRVEDFEAYLLDMDAIYVGGGNTLNMLAIWKEQGIDRALEKAAKKGIVLGGGSAGSICWFEAGCSDSRPGKLTAVNGMGWLPGSHCPHFGDEKRRTAYSDLILHGDLQDGIAIDDGAAVLYEDGRRVRVVASVPKAKATLVKKQDGKIDSTILEAELLSP